MTKKLLLTASLASVIGIFAAAKHVVEAGFAEPAHNCMEHSDGDDPAVLAHHKTAK